MLYILYMKDFLTVATVHSCITMGEHDLNSGQHALVILALFLYCERW